MQKNLWLNYFIQDFNKTSSKTSDEKVLQSSKCAHKHGYTYTKVLNFIFLSSILHRHRVQISLENSDQIYQTKSNMLVE